MVVQASIARDGTSIRHRTRRWSQAFPISKRFLEPALTIENSGSIPATPSSLRKAGFLRAQSADPRLYGNKEARDSGETPSREVWPLVKREQGGGDQLRRMPAVSESFRESFERVRSLDNGIARGEGSLFSH